MNNPLYHHVRSRLVGGPRFGVDSAGSSTFVAIYGHNGQVGCARCSHAAAKMDKTSMLALSTTSFVHRSGSSSHSAIGDITCTVQGSGTGCATLSLAAVDILTHVLPAIDLSTSHLFGCFLPVFLPMPRFFCLSKAPVFNVILAVL